jgi:hypothetical protein
LGLPRAVAGAQSYRTHWCRCPGLRGRDRGGDSRARVRGIILADDGGEQWVESKGVVVVEELEAQRQGVDPLSDQILDGVLEG